MGYTEAAKRAGMKWQKANTKQFNLRLHVRNDADIIEHLGKVGNVCGYLKRLIREDMR